ncbi:MAG: PEP/pyruvate-binding domain-containing protein, partial [Halobacteriaceae archaeon]
MAVLWLDDIRANEVENVGGKGASLGEMTDAGLPVPDAFVITADTYRSFIEETGIQDELFDIIDVDPENSSALANAETMAKELIMETELPDEEKENILSAYNELISDSGL